MEVRRSLVVNATPLETRIALLENGQLCELFIERTTQASQVGDVYKGKVAKLLQKSGIEADAFHADKSQSARQRTLARFKSPDPMVLIATDIAARGLDIDMVSHVINFDMPVEAENYVHRIGRTGRAGADGVALSFCDVSEREVLRAIQKLTRQTLNVEATPKGLPPAPPAPAAAANPAAATTKKGSGPRGYFPSNKPKRSGRPRRPAYAGR